jgi:predicted permease
MHKLKNRETKHVLAVAGTRVMDVLCGIGKVLRQPSQLLLVGVALLDGTTTPGETALPTQIRVRVQFQAAPMATAALFIAMATGAPMDAATGLVTTVPHLQLLQDAAGVPAGIDEFILGKQHWR